MIRYLIGDVFARMAELPDGSVDLILTSPPFLALRSYLPADHPDKGLEIGSEPDPATFVDTLLRLSAEWRRLLAPHGTLAVELGDTYSGSGGAGGDYNDDGLREGQAKFGGSAKARRGSGFKDAPQDEIAAGNHRVSNGYGSPIRNMNNKIQGGGPGWPDAKCKALIPELYRIALAYGIHPLTGQASPAGRWRVRNVVTWCLDGDTVVYARTPKGEGPARLLHLSQSWQPGQWELWDGQRWTPVLGWSSTEATDAIEIEFRNGEKISTTRNHEWPTQRGLVRTDELTVGDVVPSVRLPEPAREAPANLPDQDIGWLVGTFLADGSFDSRDRIQISGHRAESERRLEILKAIAARYDGTATAHDVGTGNEATVVVRSPILAAVLRRYIGGTSARNKCLRAAAWRRSNAFLRAALEGYLEGDGWWDVKNDRWRLGFTDNGWLARDLRVMCARLGWRCRLKRLARPADPRGGHFAGTAPFRWSGEIRTFTTRDLAPSGQVVALRASKRRRFFDVGVEGEPHLFALGSGLLTHNCRPNPPVGALGDKFRPATSDLVIACTGKDRWFDLDAVRGPISANTPPLDYWVIPPTGYAGSHYATFPPELCVKPIVAMCPREVCRECGEPRRRITERNGSPYPVTYHQGQNGGQATGGVGGHVAVRDVTTLGWSSCAHDDYRPGHVLDPFAGSGTTLIVAHGHGRDATGIDLDERNYWLARDRIGPLMFDMDQAPT